MARKKNSVRYQYPENLKRDTQKSYISFQTYEEEGLTISGILKRTNTDQRVANTQDGDGDNGGKYGGTKGALLNAAIGLLDKKSAGADQSFQDINFSGGKFNDIINKGKDFLSGNIVELYMPISITFPDGASYENTDLGIVGAAGENALKSGASIGGALIDSVKSGITNFAQGLTGGAGNAVGSVMVTELLKNKSGKFSKPLGDVSQLTTRLTPDPNSRVLFKGVTFREFSFQFKLIASSFDEAQQIEGLIKFFRSELYPESVSGAVAGGNVAVGLRYPNRFQIQMKYGEGRNNEVLNKIKPAYLRAVNTVYNGTQQSFHQSRNGGTAKPFEVDLTLTFQESLKLTRQDVVEGY